MKQHSETAGKTKKLLHILIRKLQIPLSGGMRFHSTILYLVRGKGGGVWDWQENLRRESWIVNIISLSSYFRNGGGGVLPTLALGLVGISQLCSNSLSSPWSLSFLYTPNGQYYDTDGQEGR
jgi:hypothetical protein